MTDKFRNKYRIASARLKNWDYGRNASYFITICTKNRAHFFGEVNPITHEMQLTEIGKLAEQFWMEIPIHFPFVQLGEFVVMPNHTHGILIIKKIEWNGIGNDGGIGDGGIGDGGIGDGGIGDGGIGDGGIGDGGRFVETRLIASLRIDQQPNSELTKNTGGFTGNKNPMIHDNISRIVRWYKGRCTFEIRKINSNFAWQPRFHDHIIRDGFAFERIQNYIANNPSNWKEDTFHVGKYLNGNRNDNTVR
ncbi:MAG: hypothetical protein IPF81_11885 [Bacteroidetes bacterium]|nr:hypothetical protein [Bacteroidota bacterium]